MPTENHDRSSTWLIDQPDMTWTLAKSATIKVSKMDGIYELASASDIHVRGDIIVKGGTGIDFRGSDTTVEVGTDSLIKADTGYAIHMRGAGSVVTNRGQLVGGGQGIDGDLWGVIDNFGTIEGGSAAINFHGAGSQIHNHGRISASVYGIIAVSDGTVVTNAHGATVSGTTDAILLLGQGPATIENKDTITSQGGAIATDGGADVVRNTGHIHGNVYLNGGSDTFDTRGGTVDGRIFGGAGDDTYLVSSRHLNIVEDSEASFDTIETTVSFTAPDNIEKLLLLGHGNISATGWSGNDIIYGNDGDNKIIGKGGDDVLTGREGNDILIGGAGADRFDFEKGNGVDHIRDYEQGVDHIYDFRVTSQAVFDALDIHDSKMGAVIEFGHGDRIILDDTKAADITYGDFV